MSIFAHLMNLGRVVVRKVNIDRTITILNKIQEFINVRTT